MHAWAVIPWDEVLDEISRSLTSCAKRPPPDLYIASSDVRIPEIDRGRRDL